MAKIRFTISVEQGFKSQVEKIARWYQSKGFNVEDEKKGGISHSAALRILVEEKLKEIEEKK